MDLNLDEKLVLVTGSTKGIGKAVAKRFLTEGAHVVIHGRNAQETEKVAQELSSLGKTFFVLGDLSMESTTSEVINQIDRIGPLDILINNTGVFEYKKFEDISDERWYYYFNTNVMSAVRLSRYYLPQMLERNTGRIIMISSEAGVKPLGDMIHYSVTKTALLSLARGMAELTKGSNVTVNSVLPGPTWTEGVDAVVKARAEDQKVDLDTIIADYFKDEEYSPSLIQRFAQVEEVADVVVFLSSTNASAINGHAQHVEGGVIRSIM